MATETSNGPALTPTFLAGLWKENPVFRLLLGMCPTLAVTAAVKPALTMGCCVIFVLFCSNIVVSLMRSASAFFSQTICGLFCPKAFLSLFCTVGQLKKRFGAKMIATAAGMAVAVRAPAAAARRAAIGCNASPVEPLCCLLSLEAHWISLLSARAGGGAP